LFVFSLKRLSCIDFGIILDVFFISQSRLSVMTSINEIHRIVRSLGVFWNKSERPFVVAYISLCSWWGYFTCYATICCMVLWALSCSFWMVFANFQKLWWSYPAIINVHFVVPSFNVVSGSGQLVQAQHQRNIIIMQLKNTGWMEAIFHSTEFGCMEYRNDFMISHVSNM